MLGLLPRLRFGVATKDSLAGGIRDAGQLSELLAGMPSFRLIRGDSDLSEVNQGDRIGWVGGNRGGIVDFYQGPDLAFISGVCRPMDRSILTRCLEEGVLAI